MNEFAANKMITTDGNWYRLLIYNPNGGTCYGYIAKQYTQRI